MRNGSETHNEDVIVYANGDDMTICVDGNGII